MNQINEKDTRLLWCRLPVYAIISIKIWKLTFDKVIAASCRTHSQIHLLKNRYQTFSLETIFCSIACTHISVKTTTSIHTRTRVVCNDLWNGMSFVVTPSSKRGKKQWIVYFPNTLTRISYSTQCNSFGAYIHILLDLRVWALRSI